MVYKVGDNIISPLGFGSLENFVAVRAGRSGLRRCDGAYGLPGSYELSVFSAEQRAEIMVEGLSFFESLCVRSIRDAASCCIRALSSPYSVLILSSTKGDLEGLAEAAGRIASAVGIAGDRGPLVVCNACVSGVNAIVLADRLLEDEEVEYVVVCGADVLNAFIVSGFDSFKSLSSEACRPFDMERLGLNLGEAAATVILSKKHKSDWQIGAGRIRNDAVHISNPSNKGEGLFRALRASFSELSLPTDEIAFVNAHGTATMFNDQMEAVAFRRAGLDAVPVNAFKGYYGHTLGAAGVLESILCMLSVDAGVALGTLGFHELGVSANIKVSAEEVERHDCHAFVKTLSGFGGCNAVLQGVKGGEVIGRKSLGKRSFRIAHSVRISPEEVVLDDRPVSVSSRGLDLLTELYKRFVSDYPKFYKMDPLSRLGFMASELLLQAEGGERFVEREDRAVVVINESSSVVSDKKFLSTIENKEDYFPSPALFVYTLPNIVTGEIAIRNHYHGETSLYIARNAALAQDVLLNALDPDATSALFGVVDYPDNEYFRADFKIIEVEK